MLQPNDEYFHGVLRVIPDGRGVRLERLTAAQMQRAEQNPAWGIRARCSAGATLQLRTDSPWLEIRFAILSSCRRYFGLDVQIDGLLTHAVRVREHQATYQARLFDLPERRPREVCVYLPHTIEIGSLEVGLAEGATVDPVSRRPRRLLTLGDSITQGMDAASPINPFPVQLARLLSMELLNQGIGGHTFDPDMLDPDLDFQPDMVIVAYGTNDWNAGKDLPRIEHDVREYLAKLRAVWPAERTRVALVSPIWRDDWQQKRSGGNLREFSHAIVQAAGQCPDVQVIDGLSLVPNQSWYLVDGVHPNDAGFLHYAMNLHAAIMATTALGAE